MSANSQKRTFKHPATSVGSIPLDCYYSSQGLPVSEEGVERRLTTILAADVVGYSRLMAADEAGTLASLKALRRELIEPKTAEHHGRVVKLIGGHITSWRTLAFPQRWIISASKSSEFSTRW